MFSYFLLIHLWRLIIYNEIMKRLLSLAIILLFSFYAMFAQSDGYRGQRKTVDNIECKVSSVSFSQAAGTLDIHFSAAVDPRSVNGSTIFIDNSPAGESAKVTFNRDGTQARVNLKTELPFTLKISGVKSYDGKPVPPYTRKLQ